MKNTNGIKDYEFRLPVFKQGDDLAGCLEGNKNSEAFTLLSQQYETAAAMCKRMAGVCSEIEVEIHADTHWISVTGPADKLDQLVKEELLTVSDWGDEEEFDEELDEELDENSPDQEDE